MKNQSLRTEKGRCTAYLFRFPLYSLYKDIIVSIHFIRANRRANEQYLSFPFFPLLRITSQNDALNGKWDYRPLYAIALRTSQSGH